MKLNTRYTSNDGNLVEIVEIIEGSHFIVQNLSSKNMERVSFEDLENFNMKHTIAYDKECHTD